MSILEHPAVSRVLRTGYPTPPVRNPRPLSVTACECGRFEAIAIYEKRHRYCHSCLEGILKVEIL